jgi:hypothetical protein
MMEEGIKRILLPLFRGSSSFLFCVLIDPADPLSRCFFAKALNKNFKTKFEKCFASL